MKHSIFSKIIVFYFLIGTLQLYSHGFSAHTLVKTPAHWQSIMQICGSLSDQDQHLTSWDPQSEQLGIRTVKSAGMSEASCFMQLSFDAYGDDITCTPTQEFYLPRTKQWLPAYQLQIGDQLLGEDKTYKIIKDISFIKEPITVYAIEVAQTHTFFVGRHAILTHNIPLPAVALGLSVPFGIGAGSMAGSIFGPISLIGGAFIGGIVGFAIKTFSGDKIQRYSLSFDIPQIEKYITFHEDKKPSEAQAPGKPTEDDGYEEPKRWDGKKVKNPNGPGYGYPDSKGRVWVPSGPNGHGGPHWDVEYPNQQKDYDNVFPGGKIRSKK